jgi:hypothetical protein
MSLVRGRCFLIVIFASHLAACGSVTRVTPDAAAKSLELSSVVEVPLLISVPPGVLPLRYQDADDDYFVSDQAYTKSIFGKIVAVPGGGVCRMRTSPFKIGVFIAAGSCDYHISGQPVYKLRDVAAANP